MAVSTTLNSKLERMLEVPGNTAQRINSLESKHSNQASSSGLNDHAGGRRAASRNPDKRRPPPGPPDDDPPPPPPPDRQSPGGGGKKSAAGGNPGNPGKPRCKYVGDGYNHLMAEFHCKGCRSDICEYCFSFKENLCEECSRNGPRCGVCRESSFLTKGIECQFCKTYYCTRHSAGQDDYRRFGFVQGRCCLACLRDETRRRRDPDGNRVRNRSPGGAPETNPTRSFSPPLRPPVDRFRDTPTGDQPNAADLQSPPKATQPVLLDKRETGYYPGFDPNGTRPKDPSGLEPPTMRGPDPPDKKCRMRDRDIPDPSKIGECKICMKRACEICIPKATRLCPVCALSIGSSQVPQHLFGTGGGGYSSHHDPNCTAATKCIAIDLPPDPDAAGLSVWISNMKEAVSNAYKWTLRHQLAN